MKRILGVIYVLTLLVFLGFFATQAMMKCSSYMREQEVDGDDYAAVETWAKLYPRMKYAIHAAFEDGKITTAEYEYLHALRDQENRMHFRDAARRAAQP